MSAVNDFDNLFSRFSRIKAGVIGDVMLDTYWWGHVERISPEAPVPVVALERKEYRIGGAGNVALNLACLDATVSVLSVTGKDDDGKELKELFEANNIDTRYLLSTDKRITTSKTRVIARNQQMMRLDSEDTKDLSGDDERAFLKRVEEYIRKEQPQVMIFEDYNKGVLTPGAIKETIKLCTENNVITCVDPKRKNFFSYKGVDIFKPNLKEVKDGLNLLIDEINAGVLDDIHKELNKRMNNRVSLITLSDKGIFYGNETKSRIIPSHLRSIADVSGAGDTVIAVASLLYAVTKDIDLMAEVANIAGGLVCQEVGTVAIRKEILLEECKVLLGS